MKARVAAQMEGRHLQGSVTDLRAGVPKSSAEFTESVCVRRTNAALSLDSKVWREQCPAKIRHN